MKSFLFHLPKIRSENKKILPPPSKIKMVVQIKIFFIFSPLKNGSENKKFCIFSPPPQKKKNGENKYFFYFVPQNKVVKIKSFLSALSHLVHRNVGTLNIIEMRIQVINF